MSETIAIGDGMTSFTPVASLIGGALIGLAAVLLMALHGRIAGMTGILSGLLPPAPAPDWRWRLAFVVGMVSAPLVYTGFMGHPIAIEVAAPAGLLLVSGLIVGVGVTCGSGCTSGHGVCGLARGSGRSIVAVITFMATAALTVFITRHVIGG
jgi:uncharacterized membrane protein YedE/YeeE